MVRLLRWLGFLVTVAFRAILGAAGGGGGGGGSVSPQWTITDNPLLDWSGVGSQSNTNQRGYEFTLDADADLTKLRIYEGNNGSYGDRRLYLWRVSDQAKLAQEALTTPNDGSFGWYDVTLGTPVSLSAGVAYIVSARGYISAGTSWTASRTTNAGSVAFGANVTFVQGRSGAASDAFPSTTDSYVYSVAAYVE